jgi:hypothetical protein
VPGDQERRRIDLAEATRGHLEPGNLSLGAEAVLPARQHPQPRARIAVECEHDVHGVLERAWPGDVSVLRDMPREQHRHPLGLGQADQGIRARSDLSRASGNLSRIGIAQGLDRIHREQERACRPCRVQDASELAPGGEGHGRPLHAQAAGARRDLPSRFLTRGEQARESPGSEIGDQLEQERGLPDAGLAGEQRHPSGDQTSSQHPVDARETRRDAPLVLGLVRECLDLDRAGHGPARTRLDRSPAAAAGASPGPLCELLPTIAARMKCSGPAHGSGR